MRFGFNKFAVTLGVIFFLSTVGVSQTCTETGSIKKVTNTSIGNYEYVIFDFIQESAPDYEVSTASKPFTDYSGDETIAVRGNKFKKIVFKSFYWMCETPIKTTTRTAVKDVKELWRFEGIAEYVVGFRTNSRYIATYHYNVGSITKVVIKFRK